MHTTTSPDGTTLAFDRSGDGSPIVLVGGAFGTRDHPSIAERARHLSERLTVHAYDQLILHEPPYDVDGARPPLPADFAERVAALVAEGRNGDAVEYFMTQGVGLPADMVASMRPTPVWAGLEVLAPTLVHDDAAIAAAILEFLRS